MVLARRHLASQQRIAKATTAAAMREWAQLDANDLRGSWTVVGPRLVAVLSAGQLAAASGGDDYVDAVAAAEGAPAAVATVNPFAFAGWAADGRPLDTLVMRPLFTTFEALKTGSTVRQALGAGRGLLATIMRSETADAGRGAVGVGIAGKRTIQGYIRVVQAPACARCVILAGAEYGWNKGFQRHPRCDCIHLPTTLVARNQHRGGLRGDSFSPNSRPGVSPRGFTDPQAYFRSLSPRGQDRIFTAAGARAIREGADMGQVVNARRGMYTADAYGRRVAATREGTTRRGQFFRAERRRAVARGLVGPSGRNFRLRTPRLLPEEIYRLAENRDEAIAMLRRFGYLI